MLAKRKFTWLHKRPKTKPHCSFKLRPRCFRHYNPRYKLTTTERKTTLGILAGPQRFVSQDNVMPQRLAFCNCTQRPDESSTDFKALCSTAEKPKYTVITDPLLELMHDRPRIHWHLYNNKDVKELKFFNVAKRTGNTITS